jgi:hypothetical protein
MRRRNGAGGGSVVGDDDRWNSIGEDIRKCREEVAPVGVGSWLYPFCSFKVVGVAVEDRK